MHLLPSNLLVRTGEVDHADWNYKPVLGAIQRTRFRLAIQLLPAAPVGRLLEIGYGSGVFMPELALHCRELHGVDVHANDGAVCAVLARHGVKACLHVASASKLPFDEASLDCVVAISSLEFVDDLDQACGQVRRVLRPSGCFIVVTPGVSPVLDFGLWLLTRKSAREDFGDRRTRIVSTLLNYFKIAREIRVPRFGNSLVCAYRAFRLVQKSPAGER